MTGPSSLPEVLGPPHPHPLPPEEMEITITEKPLLLQGGTGGQMMKL